LCVEASLLKPRPETVNQLDAKNELDSLYAMLEQPWTTSGQSDPDSTKKLVTFEGIGPTDDQTGVPIATRIVSTLSVCLTVTFSILLHRPVRLLQLTSRSENLPELVVQLKI